VSRALGQVSLRDSASRNHVAVLCLTLVRAIELKYLCGQPNDLLLGLREHDGKLWRTTSRSI